MTAVAEINEIRKKIVKENLMIRDKQKEEKLALAIKIKSLETETDNCKSGLEYLKTLA